MRDAVRLVYREERNVEVAERRQHAVGHQAFGREVEDLRLAGDDAAPDGDVLIAILRGGDRIGGDAGEIMKGVNVHADTIEILTTKEGTEQICKAMSEYQTLAPAPAEERLEREADVDGKMIPVFVKSKYAELTVDGVKVTRLGAGRMEQLGSVCIHSSASCESCPVAERS